MFKEYMEYLRDNPQGYWFKRKLYGWGWTPVKWQGWAVIIVYVLVLALLASTLDEGAPFREVAFMFLLPLAILTAAFIRICYKKGEKPKWSWGEKRKEENL
jgi:hypothetical protein